MNTVILLCNVLLAATPVAPTADWHGIIADASLQKIAPAGHVLADAESVVRLWKAWRPGEEAPAVDFAKELVLVAVADMGNQVRMHLSLDDKGDLRIAVYSTDKAGTGFGYQVLRISRAGIKTIQGKPL